MEKLLGLPLHPLLVHAPVIIVPLFILAAICYAVIPKIRQRIGWVVMTLSVLAALSAFGAWWSGHQFYDTHVTMIAKAGADPSKFQTLLQTHLDYGDILAIVVPVSSLVVLVFGFLNRWQRKQAIATDAESDSPTETDTPAATAQRPAALRIVMIVLAVAIVGLSGASGWYTVMTGHSGAQVVWGQPK